MTAVCGGGTSSAQAGFGEFVYVAPAAIGALLNNIPTAWAVGLAGFIGSMTFRLATFCTTDPPAVPTFTAQDVVDLLNPYNPFTYNTAQSKFQDLVGAFMWPRLCKCDSGAAPTAPTPPAAPTGMPSINPPAVGPAYPTGLPCDQAAYSDGPLSSGVFHQTPLTPIGDITYFVVDYDPGIAHTTSGQTGFAITFYDASGTDLGSAVSCGISTTSLTSHAEGAPPAGTTQYRFQWATTGTVVPAVTFRAAIAMYCGTTTPSGNDGPVPQPCPTDPFVLGLLQQILALATLIQRQAAPFAYIAGASHGGLSGQGSFAVQGLLGARVEVTNFGFNTGVEDGDPDELWHAGWVNWGNADGVSSRQFLTNAQMLTLPSLAGQYTEFHYSLQPGVVITVTELEREP